MSAWLAWSYTTLAIALYVAGRLTHRAPGRALAQLNWAMRQHPWWLEHPWLYRVLIQFWPCALVIALAVWTVLIALGPLEVLLCAARRWPVRWFRPSPAPARDEELREHV